MKERLKKEDLKVGMEVAEQDKNKWLEFIDDPEVSLLGLIELIKTIKVKPKFPKEGAKYDFIGKDNRFMIWSLGYLLLLMCLSFRKLFFNS